MRPHAHLAAINWNGVRAGPSPTVFHTSLGQFFLVLSRTHLSLPTVSNLWSVPDDI